MEQVPVALSQMQTYYWFAYDGVGPPPFHTCVALYVFGPLDVGALKGSLRLVSKTHEALSTRFVLVDDVPHQTFDAPPIELVESDLRGLAAGDRESKAAELMEVTTTRRFDLASGVAPIRVLLLRLTDGEAIVTIVVHHIICDLLSLQTLVTQLVEAYREAAQGRAKLLEPTRFSEYLTHEQAARSLTDYRARCSFWREWLATAPSIPPSSTGSTAREMLQVPLGEPFEGTIEREAKRAGVRRTAALLARFSRAVGASAGASDLTVGIFTANRRDERFANAFGCLAQWLPLRLDLPQDDADEACRRCQKAVELALANVLPVGDLFRAVGRPRLFDLVFNPQFLPDVGRHPLEDASRASELVALTAPLAQQAFLPARIDGTSIYSVNIPQRVTQLKFAIWVRARSVTCHYDGSRISAQQALAMVRAFAAPHVP